nr:hypothetical protein [Tanacetum cinerariifolium]
GEFNSDFHPMVDFIAASPLRRNLKLRDEDGIVSIPDTELFENLTLMGPKSTRFNEFSSNIATALVCLATNRTYNFSKIIFDVDEPVSPVRDVSKGEACPTKSGFIADQDRATIPKSSTLPHDSAPRVTSPAADEGSMQQTIFELTALCTSLQRQHSELLAKFQAQEKEILRSINEGEAAAERISNDSEEIARVLTSMDAATVFTGGIDVPTGSGSIPTAGPHATVISTGSEVGPTTKEQQEKEDIRMNEQIARDEEVARIHAEEEIQGMIDSLDRSNETIAKYLQEYQEFASELPLEKRIEKKLKGSNETIAKYLQEYQDFASELPLEKRIELISDLVEDFIPMGSKEEAERLKRKGLNLEQEHVKKQKSSEEAPEIEKSTEEKIKEMMQLVPVEDVYV